ncbi:hypothetical protein HII36_02150 [Nonomuraea sp. NN258]|uniref:hypothetical protein n=1 Tax=Nonomuraea antri TaxID=2730852 RepID=UPI001568AF4B|nr:hypothetical protein [Nonomuraea antri]NRQ30644.1 hypothetical protein [Nonomuraea antri]
MQTLDFENVLERLYPWYEDDVRAKLFALLCDVTFVYASSDESARFDLSLDCALDAIAENVHEMRAEHRLSPLSVLLPAVSRSGTGESRPTTAMRKVMSEP